MTPTHARWLRGTTLLALAGAGVAIWTLSAPPSRAEGGSRIALAIGNSAYSALPPLNNAKNDAVDIAAALEQLGFSVDLRLDIDQVTMKRSIREFSEKLATSPGIGLFYFAGHGVEVDGVNYLLPVGTEIRSSSDVELEAVRADRVVGQMEDVGNEVNLIILDACRNNPLPSGVRSATRGLALMKAPVGTLIAYATGPGDVAEDGSGRNGTYTESLLRSLEIRGASIESMFKQTRQGVRLATSGRQIPWESSSLTDDVYLAGPPSGSTTPAITCPPGSQLSAGQCVALAVSCAEGSRWDGARCVPDATASSAVRAVGCSAARPRDCLAEAERLKDDGASRERIAKPYRIGCGAGDPDNCSGLGRLFINDDDGWQESRAALRKACDGGLADSCYYLAKSINDRDDDWPRARRFLERACQKGRGHKKSCAFLASGP